MSTKQKLTTRTLRHFKKVREQRNLQMLTCYDYQTACLLNETLLDLILVGDSAANVVLGYEHTVSISLEEMMTFAGAVKRGAPQTFVIADLPFGTYATLKAGINSSCQMMQKTGVDAIKLEGYSPTKHQLIERLIEIGIPVMGHVGLTPQSVHELGGYYTHGKKDADAQRLIQECHQLAKAGVFAIVLECVYPELANTITQELAIPTIGIGSGHQTDGQVLVINDLLHLGPKDPPRFCSPIVNLYEQKKRLIQEYLSVNYV